MPENFERRYFTAEINVEKREEKPDQIRGYAAVFDSLSRDFMGWREKISPRAFDRSLKEGRNIRAVFNHENQRHLGSQEAGSLRLKADEHGLAIEIDPLNTTESRDAFELVKAGEAKKMSFGFVTRKESWKTVDGEEIRTLEDVDLVEVSVLTVDPAYDSTEVGLRMLTEWRSSQEPEEKEDEKEPEPENGIGTLKLRQAQLELECKITG